MPNRDNLERLSSHHAAAGLLDDQLVGLCRLQDLLSLTTVAAPLPTKRAEHSILCTRHHLTRSVAVTVSTYNVPYTLARPRRVHARVSIPKKLASMSHAAGCQSQH
jgi:hypothetical protein